jgi:hypothetical protein
MTITQTIGATAAATFWSPQIISAIISGCVALITGGVVSVFAWRQWRIARDKLALDLFDRRLKAYQDLRANVRKRMTEVQTDINAGKRPVFVNDTLRDTWENFDDAHFLFGDDVRDLLKELDDALFTLGSLHKDDMVERTGVRPTGLPAMQIPAVMHWSNVVQAIRERLRDTMARYMQMHTIGVAKPKKPKRAFKANPVAPNGRNLT